MGALVQHEHERWSYQYVVLWNSRLNSPGTQGFLLMYFIRKANMIFDNSFKMTFETLLALNYPPQPLILVVRRAFIGNEIVDSSYVVGAAPVQLHHHSRLTPDFNGLGKDNCKTRRETYKCLDLVPLILEVWRYIILRCIRWFCISGLVCIPISGQLSAIDQRTSETAPHGMVIYVRYTIGYWHDTDILRRTKLNCHLILIYMSILREIISAW